MYRQVEVAVDEHNYVNLSGFLEAAARKGEYCFSNSKDLGAVLVWKRGHGSEVKRGFLFLRKFDYLQSELLVSMIELSKKVARKAWVRSEAGRQRLLDELTTLEGRRWGRAFIQAGRGTIELTVQATFNLLVRWGAISRPRTSLHEFRAGGNWPPEGRAVLVEQAAIGEAVRTATMQAHKSIEDHKADQSAEKLLFYKMIRPAVGEDSMPIFLLSCCLAAASVILFHAGGILQLCDTCLDASSPSPASFCTHSTAGRRLHE